MRLYELLEGRGMSSIVVDVQPAYARIFDGPGYHSWVESMMEFLNKQRGPILMFVNAEQDALTPDTVGEIQEYWEESGFDHENWHRVQIVDKGYGFFRGWMDQKVPDDAIIKTIRLMYQNKVYDSRELFGGEDSDDYAINMEVGLGVPEEALADAINVKWTSVAQLKEFSGSYIMGGCRNECLREVELLMNAFNIKYKRIEEFTYE